MTIDNHNDDAQAGATSSTSLRLAAERTELALIRTGFSASAFGAGMTHMLGRGVWPNSAVDILTIIFVIAGSEGYRCCPSWVSTPSMKSMCLLSHVALFFMGVFQQNRPGAVISLVENRA